MDIKNRKKNQVIGILAHVDAGKTTLAEGILYQSGSIRKLGRVDHGDAFLDTFAMERARGITIFSKQAQVAWSEREVTLLDTPGHVDFSAEMERTLQVLDTAILVISGADGVQGHTQTLWKLLKRYRVPVFLFINKMDQPGTNCATLLAELQRRLDGGCVNFDGEQDRTLFHENLAMCDEILMEAYLEKGDIDRGSVIRSIAERKVFPCYFGSALRMQGVAEFWQGLEQYTRCPDYGAEFGARVFKIARDEQHTRLTYMKITGGSLKVRDLINGEKVNQIRIYSGSQFQAVEEVPAGAVCAICGPGKTYAGKRLGIEATGITPMLEPVLAYRIQLPPECDIHKMYTQLCTLEEEEPQLHVMWDEVSGEIRVQVMGEVQTEVLKSMIQERFGVAVTFCSGSIVYKETIAEAVEGVGHFEPLRHYAEVHLLLEPGEPGSGLEFASRCSEEMLEGHWQRLVLSHLAEKKHKGVLTGSEITNMKITLIAGRAHQKHTEGGDFRQATYRAVRQGLKRAKSVLLEPIYEFQLEVPLETLGRALSDIQRMQGSSNAPQIQGETAYITGSAPVAALGGYQTEVLAYTKGYGRLFCLLKGYEPCHNTREVIAEKGYDADKDVENPAGSVFCAHGAGFIVGWDQVQEYMHIDCGLELAGSSSDEALGASTAAVDARPPSAAASGTGGWYSKAVGEEKELAEIFNRTYGSSDRKPRSWRSSARSQAGMKDQSAQLKGTGDYLLPKPKDAKDYLLVDGYNIIFAWDELKELAQENLEAARGKLADILCNYQGFKNNTVILVFDAYRVTGSPGEMVPYHNIHIVYTKEAETADQYIEKVTQQTARRHHVTVATSDALEQMIIWGQGASRLSATGLKEEMERTNQEIRNALPRSEGGKNYLFDHLPEEMTDLMEDVRLGKRELGDLRNGD